MAAFFMRGYREMDLYIYSDESGVFDVLHHDIFVFGGILFLGKEEKENFTRKYLHAERCLRQKQAYTGCKELKACILRPGDRQKLFRSTNRCIKFGVVIQEKQLLPSIFGDKKSKQRYLDYAFKIGVKRLLEKMIHEGTLNVQEIENIIITVDEHTTATNGVYELRESILQEFKYGMHNYSWDRFFPPLFPNLKDVTVSYVDSSKKPLVRAADIIANRLYYMAANEIAGPYNFHVTFLP